MPRRRQEREEFVLTEEARVWHALESIDSYFASKKFHRGGPIPQEDLHSQVSVETVLNTSVDAAFDFIYSHLIPQLPVDEEYEDHTLTWDIHYALILLRDAHQREIARTHIPGLLVLYFKFCKGLEVPYPIPEPEDSFSE